MRAALWHSVLECTLVHYTDSGVRRFQIVDTVVNEEILRQSIEEKEKAEAKGSETELSQGRSESMVGKEIGRENTVEQLKEALVRSEREGKKVQKRKRQKERKAKRGNKRRGNKRRRR